MVTFFFSIRPGIRKTRLFNPLNVRRLAILIGLWLLISPAQSAGNAGAMALPAPVAQPLASFSSAELAAAVNQLRLDNGLNALNIEPILMQTAQTHAAYMAATGNVTHYGADGSRPFQRALAAGYPVAGDLSLGGFFSQNILTGPEMSVEKVIEIWMGDAPHQNTMLSPNRSDIGAGIAWAGNYGYYVIETALRSSQPVSYTPAAGEASPQDVIVIAPRVTSTPQPDGAIIHTVHSGESLWSIAAVYGLAVDQLSMLNQINPNRFIYPGDQLKIQGAFTATPTASPTPRPTSTRRPRLTASGPQNNAPPAGQSQASSATSQMLIYLIFGTAVTGVVLLFIFRPRPK